MAKATSPDNRMIFNLYNSSLRANSIFSLLILIAITSSSICVPTSSFAGLVQDSDSQDLGEQDEAPAEEDEAEEQEDDSDEPYQLSPNRRRRSQSKRNVEQYSKRANNFVALFQPVVESASKSVVQIYSGGRQLALGLIVDSDGLILTKASELKGELKCQLPNGKLLPAEVYGIHAQSDLAMLRVKAASLNVVQFATDPAPQIGQWVASPLPDNDPLVGIVSVNTREIPPSTPFIGISMTDLEDRDGVRITFIVSKSPADEAGLWVNDVITRIDSTDTTDIESLRETLGQYDPGERITLTIMRGDTEKKIKLTLAEKDKASPQNQRSNQQNSMGSKLSRRRKAFPDAFQHDSMLTARNCGGPVVNIDGKVIGINIARAGRVANYSLPVSTIEPILAELKTGNLAPEIVNKEAIQKIELELEELAEKSGKRARLIAEKERKLEADKIRLDEANQMLNFAKERVKKQQEQVARSQKSLSGDKNDEKQEEQVRKRLTDERKFLSSGRR